MPAQRFTLGDGLWRHKDGRTVSPGTYVPPPVSTTWPTAAQVGSRVAFADLTPSSNITTTAHGQVIEGLRFDSTGGITVLHDNVVIRDCYLNWRPTASGQYAIKSGTHPSTGLRPASAVIEHVEIAGRPDLPNVIDAVVAVYLELWRGVTAHHLYIHDVGRGFRYRDDCVLEDSLISATYHQAGSGAHRTAAACDGGARNIVRRNHLICTGGQSSSALSIYNDSRETFDHLIEGNRLTCADGYISYGGCLTSKAFPVGSDIRYVNNAFEFVQPYGQLYGAINSHDVGSRGNTREGNYWLTDVSSVNSNGNVFTRNAGDPV